jgi:hypothetical protein
VEVQSTYWPPRPPPRPPPLYFVGQLDCRHSGPGVACACPDRMLESLPGMNCCATIKKTPRFIMFIYEITSLESPTPVSVDTYFPASQSKFEDTRN